MDKFTDIMLEKANKLAKKPKRPVAVQAIKKNRAVYLMAVGELVSVSKAIKKAGLSLFRSRYGSNYEFEVEDMPVTVAVDANGTCTKQAQDMAG